MDCTLLGNSGPTMKRMGMTITVTMITIMATRMSRLS